MFSCARSRACSRVAWRSSCQGSGPTAPQGVRPTAPRLQRGTRVYEGQRVERGLALRRRHAPRFELHVPLLQVGLNLLEPLAEQLLATVLRVNGLDNRCEARAVLH